MTELIKNYIGHKCTIYMYSASVTGIIESVGDGWVDVSTKQGHELINAEYISRIHKCPVKKK